MAKKKENKEDELPFQVVHRYKNRLSVLRQAQEYAKQDNIPAAVEYYISYLNTLSGYYKTTEEKLRPTHFDKEKDLPEMLLISQVYWDLAKAYDRNPRLTREAERCLQQFATFTVGFKYQYLNYELLRKFCKKNIAYNPALFKKTLEQLRVHTKKCYLAQMVYPDPSPELTLFRQFKTVLLKSSLGQECVDLYYVNSPKLIQFSERFPKIHKAFQLVTKNILDGLAFLLKRILSQ